MSYATELASISRIAQALVTITADWCSRTCGSAPCAATGDKCYNTWPTCKDKAHYALTTKDYEFTLHGAPMPFPGPRPYIESIRYLPTEITDTLTLSAMTSVTLKDDPDDDVGIDPYYSTRATHQGTYWRKWVRRNRNYKGRTVTISQGFHGLTKADFVQRFVGVLNNITFSKDGRVTLQIKDLLASLADIEIPPKLDVKLGAAIDTVMTTLSFTGEYASLPASDFYIRVGDELIYVATRTTDQASGCVRGSFGTVAESAAADDKVQLCRYYEPQSPYDILVSMLTDDAGIDASLVDSASFTALKAMDTDMPPFSALISEPTDLRDLYFEIIRLVECRSWIAEDLTITIAKALPNYPGRTYRELTEAANIVHKSQAVDLNEKSRRSRIILYWDRDPAADDDEKASSYRRCDVFIDTDAESAYSYGEVAEEKIYCRWIQTSYMDEDQVALYIRRVGYRMLRYVTDPGEILTFALELKDSPLKTGEYVKISTSMMCDANGADLTRRVFQIVRREEKWPMVEYKALLYPATRIAFIAPASGHTYDTATDAEREYAYISDATLHTMTGGDPAYYIY